MLKRGLLVAVAFWLGALPANATSFGMDALPSSPVVSGNGQLEFSNFQFFSPFSSVDPGEVTVTILGDGLQLSGPASASDDTRNFFVLYEVRALGADIEGVSLLLDSELDADTKGLVLSTKQILGEPDGPPYGPKLGSVGKFGFGFPFDHDFHPGPFGRETLAFLKTAEWEVGRGNDMHPPLGLGRVGAIRLLESGFAMQESIRVVEGVTVSALDGTATWRMSTSRFTVVPEPGTAGLTLLGLALLSLRPRRSR